MTCRARSEKVIVKEIGLEKTTASIRTPYYRLSRLQMSSGTQKENKLNEI